RRGVLERAAIRETGMAKKSRRPKGSVPHPAERALVLALRLAATADGAPKRCRRMKCRAGRCMMDESCEGGVGRNVVRHAAWMIVFVAELVEMAGGVAALEKFAPANACLPKVGTGFGRRAQKTT